MNWKKHFLHGLVAGSLAFIACSVYVNIYNAALGTDFHKLVNTGTMAGACLFGCILMSLGFIYLYNFNKSRYSGILNILIAVLSFASIVGPFAITLPLDTPNPELFPGLVIPMHFFPALAFFTIAPFFKHSPPTIH